MNVSIQFLTWKIFIIFQVVVVDPISLLHSFTPSLLHSFTPSLLHSFTPSLLHSFTPSLLHSFTPSLLHSFTPSLLHSFTPSLHYFPLDISGGSSHMKLEGNECSSENLNLSYERFMWTLPELHYTPKRYHSKWNRFDYSLLFKRGSHGHL